MTKQYTKKFQENTRSDIKIQKYSSIQVLRYSSIQVFKYTIFKYSSIQVIKSISLQVYNLTKWLVTNNNVKARDPVGSKNDILTYLGSYH